MEEYVLKKGDQTRAAILETGRALFSERGYAAVTMKDFCDRLGLSRGGLYRHFASTKEIFVAMLDLDKESSAVKLDQAMAAGIPPRQIFDYFIRQQRQEIQLGGGRLSVAVYEFCIANPDQKPYLDRRFATAVQMLEKLIRYGQEQQVFMTANAEEAAAHIIVFLEGLRLSSAVITFTSPMMDDQLGYLYDLVGIAENDMQQ
jgi:AcrR family transcriptional regulator